MNKLQIKDRVTVTSPGHPHHQKTGMILGIEGSKKSQLVYVDVTGVGRCYHSPDRLRKVVK